jgi:hypothetical protein
MTDYRDYGKAAIQALRAIHGSATSRACYHDILEELSGAIKKAEDAANCPQSVSRITILDDDRQAVTEWFKRCLMLQIDDKSEVTLGTLLKETLDELHEDYSYVGIVEHLERVSELFATIVKVDIGSMTNKKDKKASAAAETKQHELHTEILQEIKKALIKQTRFRAGKWAWLMTPGIENLVTGIKYNEEDLGDWIKNYQDARAGASAAEIALNCMKTVSPRLWKKGGSQAADVSTLENLDG